MKQMTLAAKGFEKHHRATRKAEFLARMERLMPWSELCALIERHYLKEGNGRPPIGLARTLRMHCVANWFNLSDEACEDALYDVPVFREFCRFDLGRERVPDSTTLLNFRHLLEEHHLGAALFAKVGELLLANGMTLSGVAIVDAALIAAPPSVKNQGKARDPEMHQTRKCNQWHFGMKVHIGTDSQTCMVHSASVTAANVHDSHEVLNLLHGRETRFYGDSAYWGKAQRERLKGDAQSRQMGTTPHRRCASGMSENQGNHLHSGSKTVGYSMKTTFLSRIRLDLTSPLNFSVACSALP
jgi:IS5 family transposase